VKLSAWHSPSTAHAVTQQQFTMGVAATNLKNGSLNKASFLLIIPLQKENNN
jgi:hypothetical protein